MRAFSAAALVLSLVIAPLAYSQDVSELSNAEKQNVESEKAASVLLSELLSPMQSLQGQFQQVMKDATGEILQESEGKFSLKRPGNFRWETAAPYEQLLVSNQETLWLFDPDLEQVTVRPFDQRFQQTPALLLSGDVANLEQQFSVDLKSKENKTVVFVLKPKNSETLFDELTLRFGDRQLNQMSVLDSLGQTTVISLNDLTANQDLADSLFHFEAPEGTDVIIDH